MTDDDLKAIRERPWPENNAAIGQLQDDVSDLCDEVERLRARLGLAEAVCMAVLSCADDLRCDCYQYGYERAHRPSCAFHAMRVWRAAKEADRG